MRMSIGCFDGSLAEHAERLGLDRATARRQLNGLADWGLVTRGSGAMRCKSLLLSEVGMGSLCWNAPPRGPEETELDWARGLVQSLANLHVTTVHAVLKGKTPIATERLCRALLEAGWAPMRVQVWSGMPWEVVQRCAMKPAPVVELPKPEARQPADPKKMEPERPTRQRRPEWWQRPAPGQTGDMLGAQFQVPGTPHVWTVLKGLSRFDTWLCRLTRTDGTVSDSQWTGIRLRRLTRLSG